MQSLLALHTSVAQTGLIASAMSLLLAFVLSTVIAITYTRTFQGLSYSRSFLQSLILSSVVTCTAMLAIGDSLARGLGMMGALAMIRFRASLKDPRDMMFIFISLAVGIATGVHNNLVAIVGTLAFSAVALVLYRSPFSHRSHYDGLLRFHMESGPDSRDALERTLSGSCRHFALITLRDIAQGKAVDYAYQIKLKPETHHAEFVERVKTIPSVRGVQLLLQETTVEI